MQRLASMPHVDTHCHNYRGLMNNGYLAVVVFIVFPPPFQFYQSFQIFQLLFGILIPKNTCSAYPYMQFNFDRVTFSSLTKTSRTFCGGYRNLCRLFPSPIFCVSYTKTKGTFQIAICSLMPTPTICTFWPSINQFRAC